MVSISHTACEKFAYKFPTLTPKMESEIISGDVSNDVSRIKWGAIVMRGGCPFDKKVFRLEQAGFETAIIYNSPLREDTPVRMSSHIRVLIFNKFRDMFLILHPCSLPINQVWKLKKLWGMGFY